MYSQFMMHGQKNIKFHSTCRHFTSSYLNFTQLHFTAIHYPLIWLNFI